MCIAGSTAVLILWEVIAISRGRCGPHSTLNCWGCIGLSRSPSSRQNSVQLLAWWRLTENMSPHVACLAVVSGRWYLSVNALPCRFDEFWYVLVVAAGFLF